MPLKRARNKIPLSLQKAVSELETAFFLTATEFATKIGPLLGQEDAAKMANLLAKMTPKYPYKLAKLNDKDGDLSKRWYLEYEVWDQGTEKLERKFHYISLKLKTKKERLDYAEKAMIYINGNLAEGNVLNSEKKEDERSVKGSHVYLTDALLTALKEKKKTIKNTKTHISYGLYHRLILHFLEENDMLKMDVADFGKQEAVMLFDWLEADFVNRNEKNIATKTFNNYKGFVFALFNVLTEQRDYFVKNPIKAIKDRTIEETAKYIYTETAKNLILITLKEKKKFDLYYFCKFIYYTLSRPTEIIKIQGKHIFADKIMFTGSVSKNDKTQYIPITPGCFELLQEMGAFDIKPDAYLFSRSGVGGKVGTGENQFGQRHTAIIRELGFGRDYNMYTWKHTGACDLYRATKDLILIKDMCRHHSIEETMKYLRGLGMMVNESDTKNAPKLDA
jgi:hypothetical protein